VIEVIQPDDGAPPSGVYSPALRCGDFVFVSGQGPVSSDGSAIGSTFVEEAEATMDNIEAIARAAGGTLANLVRLGAYLADMNDFDAWDSVCLRRLQKPYPTRTTLPVNLVGLRIEIDAVLWLPRRQS
jgi:2-iminobutanoate/2-iminopropanoate deaminase